MPDALRIREVFNQAFEVRGSARAECLELACAGDTALRHRVEALLAAAEEEADFLASPTGHAPDSISTLASPLSEAPGTRIGPYKLLQQIGEGGFGVVFLAEQETPVQRRVALKIIKLGMDTRQVVARFEQERQALAMMEHPNIAKVFDAGATETGRPYFAMELVTGDPITRYCDSNNLSVAERLDLFQQVCHAIQHAHQKGIIHRDIKPSNVLVTVADGRPIPKVIDFGIAKATLSKLTAKTLLTEHHQVIGTLQYMSPEQAEGSLDIDTRTDVYSLGVLLYELLTGSTPFDKQTLRDAMYGEIQRMIRDVEPPKPSTRLRDSTETLASIAAHRHTEPARLSQLIQGDLDWIVMKCLDKDRTRRYETANGLSADIKRHLDDEPVTAAAPSTAYKLRKFVKRNRAQVIAAGFVAGALVLGVVGTTTGMVWALDEKDRADAETTKATLAATSEAAAKVQAQENEKKAVAEAKRAETISEFVTTALGSGDAENVGGGHDMTILAAMDNAIKDIDSGRFEDDPETEAALKDTIGTILCNNGKHDKAKPLLEQALAMRERLFGGDDLRVAASLNNVAKLHTHLGRYTQAEPLYTRALAIREKAFGPEHPDVALNLTNLASSYSRQGQYSRAEPLYLRALAIREKALRPDDSELALSLNNLGSLYCAQGQNAQAEPFYTRALAIWEKALGSDHPHVAGSLSNLANVYSGQDEFARAEAHYARSLAIWEKAVGPDHPDVLRTKGCLALLYWRQGKLDQSIPVFEAVLEAQEAQVGRRHPDTLQTVANLGVNYKDAGRLAEAEPLLREALENSRSVLGDAHPNTQTSISHMGFLLEAQGKLAEAEAYFREALELSRRLFKGDHPLVANRLNNLASDLLQQGRAAEAEPLFVDALEMLYRLFEGDHAYVAKCLDNLAKTQQDLGHPAEAEPLLARALEMRRRLYKGDHPDLATGLNNLASVRQELGRAAEAEQLYVESLEMRQRIYKVDHPAVAEGLSNLARTRQALGKTDEARQGFDQAVAILLRFSPDGSPLRAHVLWCSGSARFANKVGGGAAAALPELEQAVTMAEKSLTPEHPHLEKYRETLAKCRAALAEQRKSEVK